MDKYNAEFLKDFIEIYRSFPCLWKVKSPDYCNRYKKKEAFDKLIQHCQKSYPHADLKFVKQKIQNLRTVYKKELNKVEQSKKSGSGTDEVYVPKLWYYDLLAFTHDSEISRPSQSSLEQDSPACLNSSTSTDLGDTNDTGPEICSQEVFNNNDETSPSVSRPQPCSTPQPMPAALRRKKKKTADLLQQATQLLDRGVDEFEGIGLNVAGKLRRMDERQRIYCEKLLTELLAKGLLGELDADTVISSRRQTPSTSSPPVPPSAAFQRYGNNYQTQPIMQGNHFYPGPPTAPDYSYTSL